MGQEVGLVVVSHSRVLADAAVALAAEMVHGPLKVAVAAGLDGTTFGTDAFGIAAAIEQVDGPEGVVVLMDLGSAVLSTELALDLIADPTVRDRVILSSAPIVEGLIVAAVAAAGGATRAEVAEEARGALMGKTAHLDAAGEVDPSAAGPESGPASDPAGPADPAGHPEKVATFRVEPAHGLHARPAARLVNELRGLDATVVLRNLTTGAGPVPAASLSRVATLGAQHGHEIEVRATGVQAAEAVQRLVRLAGRGFDEGTDPRAEEPTSGSGPERIGAGTPLPGSPGIAIGPVRRLGTRGAPTAGAASGDPAAEWGRVVEAIATVRQETEQLRATTAREVGEQQAGIFDAHLALLADAELLDQVRGEVDTGQEATAAWLHCISTVEALWAALPDPYLRERAADVRAVGDQVLAALTGDVSVAPTGPGILVARDLTPAQAAALRPGVVQGVILAQGSATSHAAILARALEIPLVVSAGPGVLLLDEGTPVALDGSAGVVHVDPSAAVRDDFERRAADAAERKALDFSRAEQPAVTDDGTPITVEANLGSGADARAALAGGADGAGLVRTEFLFLGRESSPDAEEQEREYSALAAAMADRPVTLRTLDVGGDKPLSYLPMPAEDNPYLGQRGIRLSLAQGELLREQLVAVCRTARRHDISVMFPMVATVGELVAARQLLAEAAGPAGLPGGLRVGMMIEVPAAALKIESFLPHVDFVSIGTNDLTQYTLAAERGNAALAALSDPLDPGVLRLIDQVCRAARGRAEVAVCGEAAADELALPVLLGLGVRAVSVAASAVPRVKAQVRRLDLAACRSLAAQAVDLAGADEVRALAQAMLAGD